NTHDRLRPLHRRAQEGRALGGCGPAYGAAPELRLSGLLRQRYSLVARFALSCRTRCPLVMGGRSATHVVGSSARPLGGRRRVAFVDHVAAARVAEYSGVHITAAACPGAVPVLNTTPPRNGR